MNHCRYGIIVGCLPFPNWCRNSQPSTVCPESRSIPIIKWINLIPTTMGILRNGGYVEHIGMTGMCQQRSYNKSEGFTWDLDEGVGYERLRQGPCKVVICSDILPFYSWIVVLPAVWKLSFYLPWSYVVQCSLPICRYPDNLLAMLWHG